MNKVKIRVVVIVLLIQAVTTVLNTLVTMTMTS